MDIGTALRLYATADADVAAAIGDRLTPGHQPQGEQAPAATYQTITGTPAEHLGGDAGHTTDRIQFDVYGEDPDVVSAAAKKIRKRLLTAFGSLPADETDTPETLYVTGVTTAGGVRNPSTTSPTDASDRWLHRASFDLEVGYNPPE